MVLIVLSKISSFAIENSIYYFFTQTLYENVAIGATLHVVAQVTQTSRDRFLELNYLSPAILTADSVKLAAQRMMQRECCRGVRNAPTNQADKPFQLLPSTKEYKAYMHSHLIHLN